MGCIVEGAKRFEAVLAACLLLFQSAHECGIFAAHLLMVGGDLLEVRFQFLDVFGIRLQTNDNRL